MSMNDLLSQKMSRKQFLLYLGLIVLFVSGIAGILKRTSDVSLLHLPRKTSKGFGRGPYGGTANT